MVSNQNFAAGANMNLSNNASGTWDMQARWISATHSRFNGRFLSYAWPGTSISVRFHSDVTDFWRDNMMNGISAWNDSDTPINFSTNTNSINEVRVVFPDEDEEIDSFGWITSTHLNGRVIQFDIEMNATLIVNYATEEKHKIENYITSVFAHELGHAAGLADDPNDAIHHNGSIMNTDNRRCRNTITKPTSFDINSINMIH
jgi:hypothetical protein